MLLQYLSFDETKLAKHVHVDFCIRSDYLDPTEVTVQLGIQPSRAWAKGEKYLGKMLDTETRKVKQCWRERPWGIWAIDSQTEIHSKKVESHALYLLDMLEAKKDQIKKYIEHSEKYFVRFYIWWESSAGHGSYDISSDTLRRMTSLCQYIQFGYLYEETTTDS